MNLSYSQNPKRRLQIDTAHPNNSPASPIEPAFITHLAATVFRIVETDPTRKAAVRVSLLVTPFAFMESGSKQ